MGKESFLIYKSFYKPISKLSDKQLGRLFRAIFKYNLGEVVSVEEDIEMAFAFFKNQFELDEDKYQSKVERNRENGRKGGATRCKGKSDEANASETSERLKNKRTVENQAKQADNDKDNEVTDVTNNIATNVALSPTGDDVINFARLVDYFNATLKKHNAVIPAIRDIKGKRKDAVRARVRERGKESLVTVFEKAAVSDFLNGKNERGFFATFDWITSPRNFIKILEGNYDNRKSNGTNRSDNATARQRAEDAASTVARLLAEDDDDSEVWR